MKSRLVVAAVAAALLLGSFTTPVLAATGSCSSGFTHGPYGTVYPYCTDLTSAPADGTSAITLDFLASSAPSDTVLIEVAVSPTPGVTFLGGTGSFAGQSYPRTQIQLLGSAITTGSQLQLAATSSVTATVRVLYASADGVTTWDSADTFTFLAALTMTPNSGPVRTLVTLTATEPLFDDHTLIFMCGQPIAPYLISVSRTVLTFETPLCPAGPGVYLVTTTNPAGTAGYFTWPPIITNLPYPASGPKAGGTLVNLWVGSFGSPTAATRITLCGTTVAPTSVDTADKSLIFVTPKCNKIGTMPITTTNPTISDLPSFTYTAACAVTIGQSGRDYGSLQAAIDAARPGDTLTVKGTCVGSSTVTKSLTVRGQSNPAFGPPILDGGGERVLFVDFVEPARQGYTFTIDNLTITHGFANNGNGGGGLLAQGGTVALTNTVVTRNSTVFAGGGIQNESAMTLTNTSVTNNFASEGGGIASFSFLTLASSTISGNTAQYYGGGLFSPRGSVAIVGSAVVGNHLHAGDGGGIWNAGSLTIETSTVGWNDARNQGGGIFNGGSSPLSSLTITDSVIRGNSAFGSSGGIATSGTLNVTGSQVIENWAALGSGGIGNHSGTVTITGSSVSGNRAVDGSGGGITNASGTVTLTGSSVTGNTARSGGGLGNGANMVGQPSTMTISGSTITGNKAVSGGGGGVRNAGTLSFVTPETTVGGNTATTGGGVLFENANGLGLVAGGCPVSLGGHVLYSPTNTPTDYSGFVCP